MDREPEIKRAALWRLAKGAREPAIGTSPLSAGSDGLRGASQCPNIAHGRYIRESPGAFPPRGPYLHREPKSSRFSDLAPRT